MEWLRSAEQNLEKSERFIGQDLSSLEKQCDEHGQFLDEVNDQKGDIKFLTKAGQTYLDMAKVIYQIVQCCSLLDKLYNVVLYLILFT